MNAPDRLARLIALASQTTPAQLHELEAMASGMLASSVEPADSKTPTIPAPPPEPEEGSDPAVGEVTSAELWFQEATQGTVDYIAIESNGRRCL